MDVQVNEETDSQDSKEDAVEVQPSAMERISEKLELEVMGEVVEHLASNISMLVDRDIKVGDVQTSHETERPAGQASIHISFKLSLSNENGDKGHGCLLVPLPDALSMACYLMMFPESEVQAHRKSEEMDQGSKDAMLELGNFIGAAVDEILRSEPYSTSVRMEGCQGVRSDVRPSLKYEEGDDLLVGRASMQVHEFPEFEVIMMIPPLPLGCA